MDERKPELNQFTFTGVITQAKRSRMGLEISVEQRIVSPFSDPDAPLAESESDFKETFIVVVDNSLLSQPLGLARGDRVMVANALIYSEERKDSNGNTHIELRCEIHNRSQIQALSKENPFLGEELAKDKFCPSAK